MGLFPYRDAYNYGGGGAQDISILKSLEITHATWVPCRYHKGDM